MQVMKKGIVINMNTKLENLKFRLKECLPVRLAFMPIMNARRKKVTEEYIHSSDSSELMKYKDMYKGKRCFIVGNGPSLELSDLEKLKNEICFAANRIYYLYDQTDWRPDFYVAFEPEFVSREIDTITSVEALQARFINRIGKERMTYNDGKNRWLNCTSDFTLHKHSLSNIYFSEDISKKVYDAYTVTFSAIQIAVYMGFKEIYLIGMDHDYQKIVTSRNKLIVNDSVVNHCYEDKKEDYRTFTFLEGIEYAYSLSKAQAKKREVSIYNATRGGKLDVFSRQNLDEVIVNKKIS